MSGTSLPDDFNLDELHELVLGIDEAGSDLNLTNIFYFSEVPGERPIKSENFKNLFSAIEQWKAFETTKVEQQVQKVIKEKKLPSDPSVESCSKRTAYRVKVLDVLRLQSSWYSGCPCA